MTLKEQQAIHTLRAHRAAVQIRGAAQHPVETSNGLHPEDRPYLTHDRYSQGSINRPPVYDEDEDEDALYTTRLPTSTRRYAPATTPPRTVMRLTRHQGVAPSIKRASRTQASPTQVPIYEEELEPGPHQRRRWRLHPTVYMGMGMLVIVVGWILLSSLFHWWQVQQDTWHYGSPRTFQLDANVRHGGISHFTVENLGGHILITEIQVSNLAKAHVYVGPVFSGAGADLQPATLSCEDVNGDGYPDLIIVVGAGRYVLINDHRAFRPSTATDTITGKGV